MKAEFEIRVSVLAMKLQQTLIWESKSRDGGRGVSGREGMRPLGKE